MPYSSFFSAFVGTAIASPSKAPAVVNFTAFCASSVCVNTTLPSLSNATTPYVELAFASPLFSAVASLPETLVKIAEPTEATSFTSTAFLAALSKACWKAVTPIVHPVIRSLSAGTVCFSSFCVVGIFNTSSTVLPTAHFSKASTCSYHSFLIEDLSFIPYLSPNAFLDVEVVLSEVT